MRPTAPGASRCPATTALATRASGRTPRDGIQRTLSRRRHGDGRADEVFFYAANGLWKTGGSSGSGFYTTTDWALGHGVGTANRFLADTNADAKADLVTFDRTTGD